MKTDDLIDLLAKARTPADPARPTRLLAVGIAGGLLLSFALMMTTLGFRSGLGSALAEPAVAAKLLFVLALAGAAFWLLEGAARPVPARRPLWIAAMPLAAMAVLAFAAFAATPVEGWPRLAFGRNWLVCLVSVPILALPPALLLAYVARERAATRPDAAGLALGLAAGALGALAYAFHCTDDAAPFVLLWYGAGIGVCGLAGRLIGPWALRW